MGLFLTNAYDVYQFYKLKSTGNSSALPLISTLVNCALWYKYGSLLDQPTMTTVNGIGLLVTLICIYTFFIYSPNQHLIERQITFTLLFLIAVLGYVQLNPSNVVIQLGYMVSGVNILMYATPAVNLLQVYKFQTTHGLISLPLTVMTILVCLLWTLFGYQLSDSFVIVPNFIGLLFGIIQLGFCFNYSNSEHLPTSRRNSRKSY
ncbi:hypothetical protein HDV06_000940 [Boothiomyces sp. JEL0866]|nr:hypothetical protein HDV06_000940 [Boothiomyces sp. JEL0866]